jgi:virginiamycin B lyase
VGAFVSCVCLRISSGATDRKTSISSLAVASGKDGAAAAGRRWRYVGHAGNSHPYGILVSHHGVPYFCEFGANKLGEINPKTMAITEHALPEGARPRRLAITADDRIYYSDFARGYLALFDPATGKVKEWASPGGAGSQPYSIAITGDGMVWYSEAGVHPNTVVRFDPKAETFSTAPIPSGGGVVRNMVATSDGRLYLACSGVNKIAIVQVKP